MKVVVNLQFEIRKYNVALNYFLLFVSLLSLLTRMRPQPITCFHLNQALSPTDCFNTFVKKRKNNMKLILIFLPVTFKKTTPHILICSGLALSNRRAVSICSR